MRKLTVKEYRRLLEASPRLWWQVLISVAYGSGLRRGEMLNLTWADVDFEKQRIHVQAKSPSPSLLEWEPKDHENRVVPVSAEAIQLLANMQAESNEGFPYVFISVTRLKQIRQRQRAGRWNPRSDVVNNLGRDFGTLLRRAGVEPCTLHDLRRSAITNWAQHLPIQVVQQLAGHSDISTTRKYYLTVRPEDMASANRVLEKIMDSATTGLTQK